MVSKLSENDLGTFMRDRIASCQANESQAFSEVQNSWKSAIFYSPCHTFKFCLKQLVHGIIRCVKYIITWGTLISIQRSDLSKILGMIN